MFIPQRVSLSLIAMPGCFRHKTQKYETEYNARSSADCLRSRRALSTAASFIKDRIITVTGASDGIGREAALTYSRYSASVVLVGRNEEKLRSVAQEIDQPAGFRHVGSRWIC